MELKELWRYPVKSMLGEQLDQAEVGSLGIKGDRQRAVVDPESGVSLSAKRYGQLLQCRAWTDGHGQVMITFPDGSEVPADSPTAADGVSALLDRPLVIRKAEAGRLVRHEFIADIATGEGEPVVVETAMVPFFDRAPLHLLTTATLREFTRLQPGSTFHRARFRPNLFIETGEEGFVEDGWVGGTLKVGAVTFDVIDHKPRCVMTTRPQGDLPRDRDVIKTVTRTNQGRAGIELQPRHPGTLYTRDPVSPPQ